MTGSGLSRHSRNPLLVKKCPGHPDTLTVRIFPKLILPRTWRVAEQIEKMILHLKNSGYDIFRTENYARPFGANRFAVALAVLSGF